MSLDKSRIVALGGATFLLFVAIGIYIFAFNAPNEKVQIDQEDTSQKVEDASYKIIGQSVEGRNIEVYTFGSGENQLLFVGGIHGGYEWNSVLLAYEAIDYFTQNPERIPQNMTVSIVPSANPDGVYAVVGKEGRFEVSDVGVSTSDGQGRFNANNVDLNRNFDCKWQENSTWRGDSVSAGTSVFSEPEAQALRDFMHTVQPIAVVFWHSQANAVYASECEDGVLPITLEIMQRYADAAGYAAVPSFDAYPITGDVEGYLASIGIPAITVELETHETIEWQKNKAGVDALLQYFGHQ